MELLRGLFYDSAISLSFPSLRSEMFAYRPGRTPVDSGRDARDIQFVVGSIPDGAGKNGVAVLLIFWSNAI